MTEHELAGLFRKRRAAYEQLAAAAETLLPERLYWTERALLRLVQAVATQRLRQLAAVRLPVEEKAPSVTAGLREGMLEAIAEAALGGHELGQWEQVDNGYEARCSSCGMSTWLGHDGLRYSLLEDTCTGPG
jgi:hypothetical protein